MATNAYFPPYEYYEGEKIVGIDAEIAGAVAEKLGLELKIEDMEFDSIITAVQTGKADIGFAGMTVTEERLKNIDFSESYAPVSYTHLKPAPPRPTTPLSLTAARKLSRSWTSGGAMPSNSSRRPSDVMVTAWT